MKLKNVFVIRKSRVLTDYQLPRIEKLDLEEYFKTGGVIAIYNDLEEARIACRELIAPVLAQHSSAMGLEP